MKKVKYKSAAHKKAALEAEQYQKQMYEKWGINHGSKSKERDFSGTYSHRSSDIAVSRVSSKSSNTPRREPRKYTGSTVIGITVLHKSCLQPIISKEQAIESATMRRN